MAEPRTRNRTPFLGETDQDEFNATSTLGSNGLGQQFADTTIAAQESALAASLVPKVKDFVKRDITPNALKGIKTINTLSKVGRATSVPLGVLTIADMAAKEADIFGTGEGIYDYTGRNTGEKIFSAYDAATGATKKAEMPARMTEILEQFDKIPEERREISREQFIKNLEQRFGMQEPNLETVSSPRGPSANAPTFTPAPTPTPAPAPAPVSSPRGPSADPGVAATEVENLIRGGSSGGSASGDALRRQRRLQKEQNSLQENVVQLPDAAFGPPPVKGVVKDIPRRDATEAMSNQMRMRNNQQRNLREYFGGNVPTSVMDSSGRIDPEKARRLASGRMFKDSQLRDIFGSGPELQRAKALQDAGFNPITEKSFLEEEANLEYRQRLSIDDYSAARQEAVNVANSRELQGQDREDFINDYIMDSLKQDPFNPFDPGSYEEQEEEEDSVPQFSTEEEAQEAFKRGEIKEGDSYIVNGESGKFVPKGKRN
jgi:hypothetical protein